MLLRLITSLILLCGIAIGSARAQTPAPAAPEAAPVPAAQMEQSLQTAQNALKRVGHALGRGGFTDDELQSLRDQIDPVAAAADQVIEDVTPRLAATQARLAQLGPAPAANAPPEAAQLASDRAQQLKLESNLNAELTQARLLRVDTEQMTAFISGRRRDIFLNNVFAQSYSILSPELWTQTIEQTPQDAKAVWAAWRGWSAAAAAQLDGWTWIIFLGALVGVALMYGACATVVRRILAHDSKTTEPTRLAKSFAALWVAFLTALPPILGAVSLVLALRAFDLADAAADPFLRTLLLAVVRVSLALAIARGLLAPARQNWRLLDLTTPVCERLLALAVTVAIAISLGGVLNSMADQIAFSLPMSVAIRGLTAVVVALVMAVSLRGILPDEDEDDDRLGPRVRAAADWYAPLRLAAWATIVALLGSVLLGYVAFSAFLLEQLTWVALIGVALYVALALANEGIAAAFRPNAMIGRGLTRSLGIRRGSLQQFAIVASGSVTLAACVAAALLALAPWGVQSTDMVSGLRAAFFGFHVAGVTISLSTIVVAVLLFAIGLLVTRWIQRWFDTRLLPATQLDVGLRNSIRTSVGYIGVIAAMALSLAHLGVDFQKIAIVAGALSVGIGFGLQSIVNNFVSGLIILWERAIRVGDLVMIGDDQGHVKRISVRATEIETFDRVTMIVPNSSLVTGVVKNWVRGDRMARIKIPLSFGAPADPEQVRDVLIGCVRENPAVVKLPAPQALLTSIDGGALQFQLVCFVDDVETVARVTSDLHFELFRRFKEAGLEPAPAPAAPTPITVQLAGLEHLLEARRNSPDEGSQASDKETLR
jgi:potassium-dependent mechanosensitive channel